MPVKTRGNNRHHNKRIIEEDVEDMKSSVENYQYLSSKERAILDAKFSKPKNESQARYMRALDKPHNKIVIATGPAGTGKTLIGTEFGVREFLAGRYEKLVFTRPAVCADEELGFLPGTLEDKMAPWIRPIYDILYRFLSPNEVTAMLTDKSIEIAPMAYMRGRTFKNTWIVADECQNTNANQFKMLLTRLGENSRMVITGDLDQHDRHNEVNGLADFLDRFKGCRSSSISSIEFNKNDIEREEVIKEVLDIYAGIVPVDYIDGT